MTKFTENLETNYKVVESQLEKRKNIVQQMVMLAHSLKKGISEKDEQLENVSDEKKTLQKKLDEETKRAVEMEKKHSDQIQQLMTEYDTTINGMRKVIEGLKHSQNDSDAIKKQLKMVQEIATKDGLENKETIKKLEQEIKKLKCVIEIKNDELRDSNESYIHLDKKYSEDGLENKETIKKLEQEIKHLKCVIEIKNDELRDSNESYDHLDKKYSDEKNLFKNNKEFLAKQLDEKSSTITRLEHNIKEAGKEIDDLRNRASSNSPEKNTDTKGTLTDRASSITRETNTTVTTSAYRPMSPQEDNVLGATSDSGHISNDPAVVSAGSIVHTYQASVNQFNGPNNIVFNQGGSPESVTTPPGFGSQGLSSASSAPASGGSPESVTTPPGFGSQDGGTRRSSISSDITTGKSEVGEPVSGLSSASSAPASGQRSGSGSLGSATDGHRTIVNNTDRNAPREEPQRPTGNRRPNSSNSLNAGRQAEASPHSSGSSFGSGDPTRGKKDLLGSSQKPTTRNDEYTTDELRNQAKRKSPDELENENKRKSPDGATAAYDLPASKDNEAGKSEVGGPVSDGATAANDLPASKDNEVILFKWDKNLDNVKYDYTRLRIITKSPLIYLPDRFPRTSFNLILNPTSEFMYLEFNYFRHNIHLPQFNVTVYFQLKSKMKKMGPPVKVDPKCNARQALCSVPIRYFEKNDIFFIAIEMCLIEYNIM